MNLNQLVSRQRGFTASKNSMNGTKAGLAVQRPFTLMNDVMGLVCTQREIGYNLNINAKELQPGLTDS